MYINNKELFCQLKFNLVHLTQRLSKVAEHSFKLCSPVFLMMHLPFNYVAMAIGR